MGKTTELDSQKDNAAASNTGTEQNGQDGLSTFVEYETPGPPTSSTKEVKETATGAAENDPLPSGRASGISTNCHKKELSQKNRAISDASKEFSTASTSLSKSISSVDQSNGKDLKVDRESLFRKVLEIYEDCSSDEDSSNCLATETCEGNISNVIELNSLNPKDATSNETKVESKMPVSHRKSSVSEVNENISGNEVSFQERRKREQSDEILLRAENAEDLANIASEDSEFAERKKKIACDHASLTEERAKVALKEALNEVEIACFAQDRARKAKEQAKLANDTTEDVRENIRKFEELCGSPEGENNSKLDSFADENSTDQRSISPAAHDQCSLAERIILVSVLMEIEAKRQRLLADKLVMNAEEQLQAAKVQNSIVSLLDQVSTIKLEAAERMYSIVKDLKTLSDTSNADYTELHSETPTIGPVSVKMSTAKQEMKKIVEQRSRASELNTKAMEEFNKARGEHEECVEMFKEMKEEMREIIKQQRKWYREWAQLHGDFKLKSLESSQ